MFLDSDSSKAGDTVSKLHDKKLARLEKDTVRNRYATKMRGYEKDTVRK
jgi:hypothetical protein